MVSCLGCPLLLSSLLIVVVVVFVFLWVCMRVLERGDFLFFRVCLFVGGVLSSSLAFRMFNGLSF